MITPLLRSPLNAYRTPLSDRSHKDAISFKVIPGFSLINSSNFFSVSPKSISWSVFLSVPLFFVLVFVSVSAVLVLVFVSVSAVSMLVFTFSWSVYWLVFPVSVSVCIASEAL